MTQPTLQSTWEVIVDWQIKIWTTPQGTHNKASVFSNFHKFSSMRQMLDEDKDGRLTKAMTHLFCDAITFLLKLIASQQESDRLLLQQLVMDLFMFKIEPDLMVVARYLKANKVSNYSGWIELIHTYGGVDGILLKSVVAARSHIVDQGELDEGTT